MADKAKHPGGRPRKALSGEALGVTMTIRLTPSTATKLQQAAQQAGIPMGEWIRIELARSVRFSR